MRPDEVHSLIIALAGTWSPISATYTAVAEDPPADHARRRAALRGGVDRSLVPA
ncbi:transcriptional regulator [Saccharomonospora piscinae]|uniref:transcriptional regulator n=1 Tax=Saccharomonospora piscinae TaxID=687388 RepID=UPI003CCA0EBA